MRYSAALSYTPHLICNLIPLIINVTLYQPIPSPYSKLIIIFFRPFCLYQSIVHWYPFQIYYFLPQIVSNPY